MEAGEQADAPRHGGGRVFFLIGGWIHRSADDLPLTRSGRIRVFHAFGDPRLHLGGKELRVEKEQVVTP